MFIGHFAPALIAATHRKAPGLGTLFVAGQLVDYGFFSLALAGIENFRITPGITKMVPLDLYDMPYTHSLLGSAVWAAAFALLIWAVTRNRSGAIIAGVVVLSHWFLDLLVHRPDLTLIGTPPKLGFGLWNHPLIAMPLEITLIAAALIFYLTKTRAIAARSTIAAAVLALVMLAVQAINWFGPPPQAADLAMKLTALFAFTLIAVLAMLLGRTRQLRVV